MHASRRLAAVLLVVAALGAIASVADARRRPKQSLSALVNGRRVKFGRKLITSTGSAETGTIAFGGGQQPHRLGQTLRGLSIGCAVALASPVFPVEAQFCSLGYSETHFARQLTSKAWAAVDGVHLTVTSFDGTRVTGTFDGTLPPAPGTDAAPVTITDGAFSILLGG